MRARNLKPGYFRNELLGKADPLIGTLFQGLWCEADREGRLEDRPLRLCGTVFPYRRSVTEKKVDKMLAWLAEYGFITRYEIDGCRYIQVIEFLSHQNPHKNEAPSKIPALSSVSHPTSTRQAPCDNGTSTGAEPAIYGSRPASSLNPSSLNPESSLREQSARDGDQSRPEAGQGSKPPAGDPLNGHWSDIERGYPKFSGRQDWISAQHHANAIIDRGEANAEELLQGVERYAAYCRHPEVVSWYHPMTPGKFFSAADKPWRQEWPPPPSKAEQQQDGNIGAARDWLASEGSQ